MRSFSLLLVAAVAFASSSNRVVRAWTFTTTTTKTQVSSSTPVMGHEMTRKSMLTTLVQGGAAAAAASLTFLPTQAAFAATTETLPSGVTYQVIKDGKGPKPDVGELVAIRFAAYYGDRKIDDIYGTFFSCGILLVLSHFFAWCGVVEERTIELALRRFDQGARSYAFMHMHAKLHTLAIARMK